MSRQIVEGDCVDAMRQMDEASVDAVVCDPPYLLGFMGKEFDSQHRGFRRAENPADAGRDDVFGRTSRTSPEYVGEGKAMQDWHYRWAVEALRVLKPGGHLLAAGGSRTYHRLVCALEDAGFEIRDCITHLYGSGFPKSLDVSKAIDKAAGGKREVLGVADDRNAKTKTGMLGRADPENPDYDGSTFGTGVRYYTAPATPEAEQWQGWGTALKPSVEFWTLCRKPLSGTVAETVSEFGTGALNIDACRVGMTEADRDKIANAGGFMRRGSDGTLGEVYEGAVDGSLASVDAKAHPTGRWPPNTVFSHALGCRPVGTKKVRGGGVDTGARGTGGIWSGESNKPCSPQYADPDGTERVVAWDCVDGCPVKALDEQSGDVRGATSNGKQAGTGYAGNYRPQAQTPGYGDSGSASRFFPQFQADRFAYVAKAGRAERNVGLHSLIDDDGKVRLCQCRRSQTEAGPPRGIDADTAEDDRASFTTGSGNNITDQSQTDSKSTTETKTAKTTASRTLNSSRRPSTSESTPPTTAEEPTASGSDAATSAASGSHPTSSTTTSAEKDGPFTADVDPATFGSSSEPSSSAGRTCPDCGGVVGGALRNSHPT